MTALMAGGRVSRDWAFFWMRTAILDKRTSRSWAMVSPEAIVAKLVPDFHFFKCVNSTPKEKALRRGHRIPTSLIAYLRAGFG